MSSQPVSWMPLFPISIAVEKQDAFKRMADMGIKNVALCCMIYSPYRLVLPRYPDKGIYSMEEGLYFYQPDPARYKDLPESPIPTQDFAGRDILAETVEGAHKHGMKVCAWVTTFANGRTAKLRPEWAVENIYGSRDRLFLDFDHPQVREFSARVVEEIAEKYAVDEVMLDKIPQTCLEQNSLAGRIDPVLRIMGTFCFSKHAAAFAATQGVDLKEIHAKAKKLATESLAIPPHITANIADDLTGDNEVPLLMFDHPWIAKMLEVRIESIRQYIAEVRKRIDGKRKGVKLSTAFVPPTKIGHDSSSPRPWLAAQSYAAYRQSALDMIHCVIHWGPDTVEYDTRRAVNAMAGSKVQVCTHVKAYGASRPEAMQSLVSAALRGGAPSVAYFCYDLLSEPMMAAIKNLRA